MYKKKSICPKKQSKSFIEDSISFNLNLQSIKRQLNLEYKIKGLKKFEDLSKLKDLYNSFPEEKKKKFCNLIGGQKYKKYIKIFFEKINNS